MPCSRAAVAASLLRLCGALRTPPAGARRIFGDCGGCALYVWRLGPSDRPSAMHRASNRAGAGAAREYRPVGVCTMVRMPRPRLVWQRPAHTGWICAVMKGSWNSSTALLSRQGVLPEAGVQYAAGLWRPAGPARQAPLCRSGAAAAPGAPLT